VSWARVAVSAPAQLPHHRCVGGLDAVDHVGRVDAVALIGWFGEAPPVRSSGDGRSIDWFGDGPGVRFVGGVR
jgi:hypothetical protein